MRDIMTVIWKEWRGVFRQRGSFLKVVLTLLFPLGFFVLFLPWEAGEAWFSRAPSLLASLATPMLLILLLVPDSFAGERERHTLPTLLASRLPDRAILFGKMLFAVAVAYGATLVMLLLGGLVGNLANWNGSVQFYAPLILTADLSLSLLMALLGSAAGVLISLRSRTVQDAQQMLTAVLFLPPTLLGPVVLLLGRQRPEWGLRSLMEKAGPTSVYLVVLAILVLITLALWLAAIRLFRRSRLLAD